MYNLFFENGGVLHLARDQRQVYDSYYTKYFEAGKQRGLTKEDYDVLISTLTLAKTCNPSVFISNDVDISKLRRRIAEKEGLPPVMFNSVLRRRGGIFSEF